jgi:amidase
VAVAANLTAVAVGTETDGSIICPASNNGIVGVKPTLGLISRSGIIPIAHSQDTAGPMGRTVADAVILLNVMVGKDDNDTITLQNQNAGSDYTAYLQSDGLNGKRIGVLRQYFGRNERVDALLEAKLDLLREGGAEVIDVEIPTLSKVGAQEFPVLLYEFKADLNHYLNERGGNVQSLEQLIEFNNHNATELMPFFGQDLIEQAQAKGSLDEEEYQQALAASKQLSGAEGIDAVMEEYNLDALLGPSNGPAWQIDLINGDSPGGYVSSSTLAAVSGYPSITVPAGFIQELPIGISFFGRAFSEPVLIAIAYSFELRNQGRRTPRFIPSFESASALPSR